MIESKKKLIGDTTYQVTQFGAKKGKTVLFTLIRLLGPAFGEGLNVDIGKAMRTFAETAREEDFDRICDLFAESTEILLATTSGAEIPTPLSKAFDSHFVGRYFEMLAWLVFCLEVNYSSFFDAKGLGAMFGRDPQGPKSGPPKE